MQNVFFHLLEQRAATTVHDALRRARHTGGIENERRLLERQLRERQRLVRLAELTEQRAVR